MITENQKLGEEMKAKDEEHNRVIREVLNELQNMNDDVANRVRPQRQGKKKGKFRYLQHVGVNSASNRELMERVKQEVFHHVGGQDHRQWSNAQIEEAFRRYFLSAYELEEKKKSGKYEEHKQKGRIREKMTRWTLARESVKKWDAMLVEREE